MRRLFKILFFPSIVITFLVSSLQFPLLAYSPNNTHPDLTEEMVKLYNITGKRYSFSNQEIKWLRQGAEDEDKPPRWINHFYDPAHKIAWDGSNFGYLSKEEGLDVVAGLTSEKPIQSIEWVVNQDQQAKYGNQYGNQTWQKAVNSYVNGEIENAFIALGHILHLVEDLSVPDHTRNDPHSGMYGDSSSPYEDYAKEYTNNNELAIADELAASKVSLMEFAGIQDAFEYLARYSNENFFSEDTIDNEEYENPNLNTLEKVVYTIGTQKIGFIYNKDQGVYLAHKNKIGKYSLSNTSHVLPSYISHLFPQAVLTGASVIELFFKEAEKYKQNPELLEPIVFDRSSSIKEIVAKSPKLLALNVANFADSVAVDGKIFAANVYKKSKEIVSVAKGAVSNVISGAVSLFSRENNPSLSAAAVFTVNEENENSAEAKIESVEPQVSISRTVFNIEKELAMAQAALKDLESQLVDIKNTIKEKESSNAADDSDSQNSNDIQTIAVYNVSEPKFSLPAGVSAGFGGGGGGISLSQNQSEENSNSGGNEDSEPVDIDAPDISLAAMECGNSLSPSGCLIATTTINFSWSSSAEDFSYFSINNNGGFSTTTATSTSVAAEDGAVYTFSVSAYDTSGNKSATSTKDVEVYTMPVVINEVAWMGTASNHPVDEWVELYNRTGLPINLDNFIFYSKKDMGPYINLSGSIGAGGYYLVERTDDNTVSDIAADWTGSFGNGLSNKGENLALVYKPDGMATSTIDEIPYIFNWQGGSSFSYSSMERYNTDEAGNASGNWSSNNGIIKTGKNADGENINATPKARNSYSYYVAKGASSVTENVSLTKAKSPYIVNNQIQVFSSGAILSAEPGVVVKFYNDAGFNFSNGAKMEISGSVSESVVFTGLYDDSYGGDTNGDATSTTPSAGNWFGIRMENGAVDSVIANAVFRYGGKYYTGGAGVDNKSNLYLNGVNANITNSTFEKSKVYGIKVISSTSTIASSTFSDNDESASSVGAYISGGSVTLSSNTFSGNTKGLYTSDSAISASSNTFTSNSGEAIYSYGKLGNYSGNSGSGNGLNGIVVSGNLTASGATTTPGINTSFPYVIKDSDASVAASSTLVLENGSVLKSNKKLNVSGDLKIEGASAGDIILTSLYDDTIGGDTTGDGDAIAPQAGQGGWINILNGGSLTASGFTARYGGSNAFGGNNSAWIYLDGASASILNAVFDNNYPYGIYAAGSPYVSISNTTFSNHSLAGGWGTKAAMAIFNSSTTTLSDVIFSNNALGIRSDSSTPFAISNITFTNNTATTSPANLW